MMTVLALDLGSVAQTVLGIGGLVFVHELGHFLVGRACGVRAEAFSIGFGPVLARWTPGETEYRLSAVPLGGYVKFLGENPDERGERDPRSFFAASYPRKVAIMLAGVTMNVLAAFVLFVAAFSAGVTTLAPVVGTVAEDSPASKAGLRPGDRILEMDGRRVIDFEDVMYAAAFSDEVGLVVHRDGRTLPPLQIPTRETKDGLRQIGISPASDPTGVLAVAPESAAQAAGLRPGDRLVAAGGAPTTSLDAAWEARAADAATVRWTVDREGERVDVTLPVRVWRLGVKFEGDDDGAAPGLLAGIPAPEGAGGQSAAAAAGLPPAFRIVAVDGVAPGTAADVQAAVAEAGRAGREVLVRWTAPEGGPSTATAIRPLEVAAQDPLELGVGAAPLLETVRETRVGAALALGFDRTHRWVSRILATLRSLVTGRVSATKLAGPIRLTRDAYRVAQGEWSSLFLFLGMLSMNLAVLNVLPIPLLDGGQLALLTVEQVRGRPLPERVLERIQWTGLLALLSFMLFVVVNDLRNL